MMRCDFHIHSCYSPDSKQGLADIVTKGKAMGLDVIAVCDHNSVESVTALKAIDTKGIYFIPGVEYSTDIGHVLALFCHKDAKDCGLKMEKGKYNHEEIISMAKEQGGVAILAHPFIYKKEPTAADLKKFFAIEGYNARAGYKKNSTANLLAKAAGEKNDIPLIAGSDSHRPIEIGNAYIEYDCPPPYDKGKILDAIKKGGKIYGCPTAPDIIAVSQLYKATKEKNIKRIGKNLLKIPYGFYIRLFAPKDFKRFGG